MITNPVKLWLAVRSLHLYFLYYSIKGYHSKTAFFIAQMEAVLVCTGHFVSRQRVDVLPLPFPVCLHPIGWLQTPASGRTRPLRACVVFLGFYSGLWGDSTGMNNLHCVYTHCDALVQSAESWSPSQTFFVGSTTVIQRMKIYIQDIWNKCDITALALFILGLLCRWI